MKFMTANRLFGVIPLLNPRKERSQAADLSSFLQNASASAMLPSHATPRIPHLVNDQRRRSVCLLA
jgi:hypothetical protein